MTIRGAAIPIAMMVALVAVLAALIGNVGIAVSARNNCKKIEALKEHEIVVANLTIQQIRGLEENFKGAFGSEPTFDVVRSKQKGRRIVLPRWQVEMNKQLIIHETALGEFAPVECSIFPWSQDES